MPTSPLPSARRLLQAASRLPVSEGPAPVRARCRPSRSRWVRAHHPGVTSRPRSSGRWGLGSGQPENRGPASPGPGTETDRPPTGSVGATGAGGPRARGRRRQGPEEARGSEDMTGDGGRSRRWAVAEQPGCQTGGQQGRRRRFPGLGLRHRGHAAPCVDRGHTEQDVAAKEDQSR